MSRNAQNGTREAVLALLESAFGGVSAVDLAEQAGLTVKGVRDCLWRLRQTGDVAFEVGLDGQPVKPRRYVLGEAREAAEVARVASVAKTLSPGHSPQGGGEKEGAAVASEAKTLSPSPSPRGGGETEAAGDEFGFTRREDIRHGVELALMAAEADLKRYVKAKNDSGLWARLRLVEHLRQALVMGGLV